MKLGRRAVLLLALPACSAPPAAAAAPSRDASPGDFELVVFDGSVGVRYEYDDLVAAFEAGGGGDARFRLDASDITDLVIGPAPSSLYAIHLGSAASSRWKHAIEPAAETLPFTLSVKGQRLFVGVLYPAIGAAAIKSPVLHSEVRDSHIVLFIGAWQGMAYLIPVPDDAARRIDRPELRAEMRRRDKLTEQRQPPRLR